MITSSEIKEYRVSGLDYEETEALKIKLSLLRLDRIPFFLTYADFDEILRWKLRSQYGRQQDAKGEYRGDHPFRYSFGNEY